MCLPGALHHVDLVPGGVDAQLVVALVRLAPAFAVLAIGFDGRRHQLHVIGTVQGAGRAERGDLVGQEFLPGCGTRAGDFGGFFSGFFFVILTLLGQAGTLAEQQGQGAGGRGPLEEGASVVVVEGGLVFRVLGIAVCRFPGDERFP
ncbi:hypothetical protein D3C84_612180 [compost metagenome]